MPYEKNELYNLCTEMVFETAGLVLFENTSKFKLD